MKTNVIGFSKVESQPESKNADAFRKARWTVQTKNGINYIPSNDFSSDPMLDTAVMLNVISDALVATANAETQKWFNTDNCYVVPVIEDSTEIKLTGTKLFDAYKEAKAFGIVTKPVVVGPYTFIRLAVRTGIKTVEDCIPGLRKAYSDLLIQLNLLGVEWVQFDEPSLVMDMDNEDIDLFCHLYDSILSDKGSVKVLLQTYFGDIHDCYTYVTDMAFDAIGLDFCEGTQSAALLEANGFPKDKTLFAGVVNGKNTDKNNYAQTLELLTILKSYAENIVIGTSCPLSYLPYSVKNEAKGKKTDTDYMTSVVEKLQELSELGGILNSADPKKTAAYKANAAYFAGTSTVVKAVEKKSAVKTAELKTEAKAAEKPSAAKAVESKAEVKATEKKSTGKPAAKKTIAAKSTAKKTQQSKPTADVKASDKKNP